MLCVISNRWVGCPTVSYVLVFVGQPGENAVRPRFTAVGGCGPAHVRAAPTDGTGYAGDVEGTDDGVAPGEEVGLNFSLVHTIGVVEWVTADFHEGKLRMRRRDQCKRKQNRETYCQGSN